MESEIKHLEDSQGKQKIKLSKQTYGNKMISGPQNRLMGKKQHKDTIDRKG